MFILTMEGHYPDGGYGSPLFTAQTFDEIIAHINSTIDKNCKIGAVSEPYESYGMKQWSVPLLFQEETDDEEENGEWEEDDMQWYLITETP